MRKSLIVLVLAFTLLLGCGVWVYCDAVSPRDEVMVYEKLRHGDASAAEGLSMTVRTDYDNHLFWDTEYTAGFSGLTESSYRISVQKDYGEWPDTEYRGIDLMSEDEYGDFFNEHVEVAGLGLAYRELWLETPAGEEREKIVYLKDYLDYYPICGELSVPGSEMFFYGNSEFYDVNWYGYSKLNEYFKIPVMEDETRYISVRKNANGSIGGRGGGSGDGDAYYFWTQAVVLPDAVYFTINNRTSQERIVDTSLIPGGYGIYRLPYSEEKGGSVDFDSLSTVKSLDEEFNIIYMFTDEPKEKIILVGADYEAVKMLVIDAETMETLQEIVLTSDGNVGCWEYFDGGDFLAFSLQDDRLALVERQENGEYILRFVVEDTAEGTLYNRYNPEYMAWDGERLAVSGFKSPNNINNRYVADFYVAVFTAEGLQYFADCDSSLAVDADDEWHGVRGLDFGAMTLKWE